MGITHVVNCSPHDCPNKFLDTITYLNINIEDNWSTDLFLVIYVILDFVNNALTSNGKVLVHCHMGISRSPSIIIAYIIYKNQIDEEAALKMVKKNYP